MISCRSERQQSFFFDRVTQTLEGRRHELERSQAVLTAGRQRGLEILLQISESMSAGDPEVQVLLNSTFRAAMHAAEEQHARLTSSAARDMSEGWSALCTQASLEQLAREPPPASERAAMEQAAALGSNYESRTGPRRPAVARQEVKPLSRIHRRIDCASACKHGTLGTFPWHVGLVGTPAGLWP